MWKGHVHWWHSLLEVANPSALCQFQPPPRNGATNMTGRPHKIQVASQELPWHDTLCPQWQHRSHAMPCSHVRNWPWDEAPSLFDVFGVPSFWLPWMRLFQTLSLQIYWGPSHKFCHEIDASVPMLAPNQIREKAVRSQSQVSNMCCVFWIHDGSSKPHVSSCSYTCLLLIGYRS